jgi:hypothetical protein
VADHRSASSVAKSARLMADVFSGAKLIQLVEWGYPAGRLRTPIDPSKAFSTIHITAIPDATAEDEAGWRLRDPGWQNSATFFLNRDGSAVQCLGDPARMDPWANGDMQAPDTSNRRIADLVRSGLNANQRTFVAIENVGNEFPWKRANGTTVPGGFPITAEQEATCARIICHYHSKYGVPITRETVVGHYQLNSVSRKSCPSADKSILDRIVALANEEDMDRYLANVSAWIVNRQATIRAGASIRSTPKYDSVDPAGNILRVLTQPEVHQLLARRPGTEIDGKTRWYVIVDERTYGFIHESDASNERPIEAGGGVPQADYDAALAQISALNGRIATKDKHVAEYPKG